MEIITVSNISNTAANAACTASLKIYLILIFY